MKILKKNSPEVEAMRSRQKKVLETITIYDNRRIFFSKAFVLNNGIKAGQYVHFINDKDDWRFYICDEKDGWLLVKQKRDKWNVQIQDSGIVRLMQKSLELVNSKFTFPVVKTFTTQNEHPVFWVQTKKRII